MKNSSVFRFSFAYFQLRLLLFLFFALVLESGLICEARDAAEISWRTGTEFRQSLTGEIGLTWESVPISKILPLLEKQTQIAIWTDRRIDKNLPVTFSAQQTTIPSFLKDITRQTAQKPTEFLNLHSANLGLSRTDSFLYVGPIPFVNHLRTLLEIKKDELKKSLSPVDQKKWLKEKVISWDRLTEPRMILTELAEERGLEIRGLKNIPHDLWPARSLPPISALELSLLILGQFDLTLEFSSSEALIIPLNLKSVVLTKSYPLRQVSSRKRGLIEKEAPETRFAEKGSQTLVRGILEVHEFLSSGAMAEKGFSIGGFPSIPPNHAASRTSPASDLNLQRLSGKIQGPFLPFVSQLCQQKGLKLIMDETSFHEKGIDLRQNILLEVENATVEETFRKMAEEIGIQAKIEGENLILTP